MSDSWVRNAADTVMNEVARLSSDPHRALSPYYMFGNEEYEQHRGRPPQVRWGHTEFEYSDRRLMRSDGSGSLGTFMQTYAVYVWGADVDECYDEAALLTVALKNTLEIEELRFEPVEVEKTNTRQGYAVEVGFVTPIDIPERGWTPVTLLHASSSAGVLTGSAVDDGTAIPSGSQKRWVAF